MFKSRFNTVITSPLTSNFVCVCVCVCVYIYIYIYTHTHTHTLPTSPMRYIKCPTPPPHPPTPYFCPTNTYKRTLTLQLVWIRSFAWQFVTGGWTERRFCHPPPHPRGGHPRPLITLQNSSPPSALGKLYNKMTNIDEILRIDTAIRTAGDVLNFTLRRQK